MGSLQLGLHVFFGCYHNLFRLMTKCGVLENLLVKEHTHTFVNAGQHSPPDPTSTLEHY
jgi:zeta-carotene desaturase